MTHEEITSLLDQADEHLDKAEYPQAETLANEALTSSALRKEDEARAHRILGTVAIRRGDKGSALVYFTAALRVNEELDNKAGIAGSLCNIGTLISGKQGLEYYERALPIAEEACHRQFVANILGNIGNTYSTLGDYPRALEYFTRSLKIQETLGAKRGIANSLFNTGVLYSRLGDYSHALEYLQKSLAIAEEDGYQECTISSLESQANVYEHLGNYSLSFDCRTRALSRAEELGAKSDIALSLNNLGNYFLHLQYYSRSIEYCTRALAIAEEIGEQEKIVSNLNTIGEAYAKLDNHTEALTFLNRALELGEREGIGRSVAYAMCIIAVVQAKLGNLAIASQGLTKALHYIREILQSNEHVVEVLLELGRVLIAQKKLEEGHARFQESLTLAEELGEMPLVADANKELAQVYARQGDGAKAYEHFQKYHSLKEDIINEKVRQQVDTFSIRVAIAKEEQEKELARSEAKVAKLEKEQAEQSLRLKERDLANTASSLAAQTELLGNFRADLRKIVLRPDRYEPEEIIKQVRNKLKELPCEMIDFSKFEGQFATVHPEFRARLETTYPELTPQEVKMCMLIHVNLQSAAIARLMCLSERSVEGHRLNIRKKFGLTKEQTLADTLRKLDGK